MIYNSYTSCAIVLHKGDLTSSADHWKPWVELGDGLLCSAMLQRVHGSRDDVPGIDVLPLSLDAVAKISFSATLFDRSHHESPLGKLTFTRSTRCS